MASRSGSSLLPMHAGGTHLLHLLPQSSHKHHLQLAQSAHDGSADAGEHVPGWADIRVFNRKLWCDISIEQIPPVELRKLKETRQSTLLVLH